MRSYVINYGLGLDTVRVHIERGRATQGDSLGAHEGTPPHPDASQRPATLMRA